MLHILLSCIVFTFVTSPSIASPLNIGIIRVINSTEKLDTIFRYTPGNNTAEGGEDIPGCFQQPLPLEPQFCRTSFNDCFNAQEQIAAHDPHRPIHFRRNNDATFVLPAIFTYRTCAILLDMVSADAEDFFYVAQIRDAIIMTARKCTSQRKALGGAATVGPKNLMEVWVFGRPWIWEHGDMTTNLLHGDIEID